MENHKNVHDIAILFFNDTKRAFKTVGSGFRPARVVKSLPGCEKWILYKILHRSSDTTIFLTYIFSLEKIILKVRVSYFPDFH